MNLEEEISNILFKIGTEIKIHKIDDNLILDIDYDRYTKQILNLFDTFIDQIDEGSS
jgi:hypothetical protein